MSALVGVIMGSQSDWDTMRYAVDMLQELGVPHEVRVVSAHRTPDLMFEYASSAEARGLEVIIAGAGGAAHLPGMVAAKTVVPVLGVPVQSHALNGLDSLLSIVQMPAGVPVATFAIGSDDTVSVWVNGEQVSVSNEPRSLYPDQDRFNVRLKKGDNRVLLRIGNLGDAWGFCLRVLSGRDGLTLARSVP